MREADIEELAPKNTFNELYLQDFDSDRIQKKLEKLPTIDLLRSECEEFNKVESHRPVIEFIPFIEDIILDNPETSLDVEKHLLILRKKYKRECSKTTLLAAYRKYIESGGRTRCKPLEQYLIKKSVRSSSGVLVITVFTSPYPSVDGKVQKFSCHWNCHYCPNEPGQPRSYLLNEPGVRRANMNSFDAVRQFHDRLDTLTQIGHEADKVEVLVLGGTFTSYPEKYRSSFVRDLFYAANTWRRGSLHRERLSLSEEQTINSTCSLRIIGLTLETRPDTINPKILYEFRQYGCTRVQLGVQHIDDRILKKINRQCYVKDFCRAIQLLKDSCFKIDIHLMPDLPGATPEIDLQMFESVLQLGRFQADQWKIYPCQTTPWTVIREWYEKGKYVPYGHEGLVNVLVYVMSNVHPWIRLNRVIRDIPSEYILGGCNATNLRQIIENKMHDIGRKCACIRCREVKDSAESLKLVSHAELVQRRYIGQGGLEFFLSFEDVSRRVLFGFLRLRLSTNAGASCFPELRGAAMIRELHIYGRLVRSDEKTSNKVQHVGFGKKLLEEAEKISSQYGFHRIAVISGIGVRTYYHDRAYHYLSQEGQFQVKNLHSNWLRKMRNRLGIRHPTSCLLVTIALFILVKCLLLKVISFKG